jgi:hypothetical protein
MTNPHAKATKPSTLARLLAWLGFTSPAGVANGFQATTLDRPPAVPDPTAAPPQAPPAPVAPNPFAPVSLWKPSYANPGTADLIGYAEEASRLRTQLPDAWDRIYAWSREGQAFELGRLVYGIAGHLPALAPTIHALAEHVLSDDVDGGCCGLPSWDVVPPAEPSVAAVREAEALLGLGRSRGTASSSRPGRSSQDARRRDGLEAELKAALSPKQWDLVEHLVDEERSLWTDELTADHFRMSESLALHFGSQAPMVRALVQHVFENSTATGDECGLCIREHPADFPIARCRGLLKDESSDDEPRPAA